MALWLKKLASKEYQQKVALLAQLACEVAQDAESSVQPA
jgi:hypothetical protein